MLRLARLAVPAALVAVLVGLLVLPAHADTLTAEGPAEPGGLIEVRCPDGQTFVSGTVTFYRRQGAKRPLATVALEQNQGGQGGFAVAPKGAHYYTAEYVCEPAPTTTTAPETVTIGETRVFEQGVSYGYRCPTGYTLDLASVVVPDGFNWVAVTETDGTEGINVYASTGTIEGTVSATCRLAT